MTAKRALRPRQGILDIALYVPGKSTVAGGGPVIKLSSNEGAFGPPPDVVVSGINPGPNTGGAVLHSGTVGAALTAANFGFSGLAVSMGTGDPMHWATAAELSVPCLEWLLEQQPRTVLNLNAPNLPIEEVRGVRWGELSASGRLGGRALRDALPRDGGLSVLGFAAQATSTQAPPVAVAREVLSAARRGFGLVVLDLPRYPGEVADELAAGRLVRLADDARLEEFAYYLVWPGRAAMPEKARAFRDWLSASGAGAAAGA